MPLTTILVEDSRALRDALITVLHKSKGVRIADVAETCAQALALVASYGEKWDLMILDLFLHDGTGLSVLQACRDRLPHQRIVVLTNMATPQLRRHCVELGADEVFDKSRELSKLVERCNSYQTA
jgi:DNA-binding NarL/FixJ family response regulator